MEKPEKPLIILGPTATGKTALAIELAIRRGGEIISLDSMQIYRGMDIGTAKPTEIDQQAVPHHCIDCQPITEASDVAQILTRVYAARKDIEKRGNISILVGGTALYIKNLVDGLFNGPPAAPALREELLALADEKGSEYLHASLLVPIDPEAAAKIHPHDIRRVIRAIEVYRLTRTRISDQQGQWTREDSEYEYEMIGLTLPREMLYTRIEERVDAMVAAGLVEEVQRLKEAGIEQNRTASQAIGYKEILAYLAGEYNQDRAVELIKRNTRRFAKHQLTWFRKDTRIRWIDVSTCSSTAEAADRVEEMIRDGLAGVSPPARK